MKIYRDDTNYVKRESLRNHEEEKVGVRSFKTYEQMQMDFKKLNHNELSCMKAFDLTMKENNVPYYRYSIGSYHEERICITKDNDVWEKFIGGCGNQYDIESFDNCYEACMAVIYELCYYREFEKKMLRDFSKHLKTIYTKEQLNDYFDYKLNKKIKKISANK